MNSLYVSRYTSFVSPVSTCKLHSDLSDGKDGKSLETPVCTYTSLCFCLCPTYHFARVCVQYTSMHLFECNNFLFTCLCPTHHGTLDSMWFSSRMRTDSQTSDHALCLTTPILTLPLLQAPTTTDTSEMTMTTLEYADVSLQVSDVHIDGLRANAWICGLFRHRALQGRCAQFVHLCVIMR